MGIDIDETANIDKDTNGASQEPINQDSEFVARTEDAYKIYGIGDTEVRALDGVNAQIRAGELTAIMGPSGSGKSTLMHCMAGLDSLTSGYAYIGEINLAYLPDKELTELRRDNVGFIFQSFNLIPTLTAKENITLPLNLAGKSLDTTWFNELAEVTGLANRMTHRPTELSGGQQQRVAVARALMGRPAIVFGDEPTGNLDSATGNEILAFLRKIVEDLKQTIVIVTHDPTAASIADRVLFLNDGKLVDELLNPTREEIVKRLQ